MINKPSVESLRNKADSPYTLCILAAKRARQVNVGGDKLLGDYTSRKPVSISLEEIAVSKVKFKKKYKRNPQKF